MNASPTVGVVMGSKSDYEVLLPCIDLLREFAIRDEARIVSAHRTPDWLFQYAEQAEPRGLKIIIAAAGGAAHLPGMLAAKTILPVLAVPVPSTCLQGIDSLLSIVQMPKGVPVATLAIGKPGAANAALLAVAILAGQDPGLGSGCDPGGRHAAARSWMRSCRNERHRPRLNHWHPGRRAAGTHDRHGRPLDGLPGAGDGSRPLLPRPLCGGLLLRGFLG